MSCLEELVDQIQQLGQQATPGPWVSDKSHLYDYVEPHPYDLYEAAEDDPPLASDILPRDAEFIALARTFAPAAAKALRTILTECESFEIAHDDEDNPFHQGVHWTVMAIRQAITDAMGADNA